MNRKCLVCQQDHHAVPNEFDCPGENASPSEVHAWIASFDATESYDSDRSGFHADLLQFDEAYVLNAPFTDHDSDVAQAFRDAVAQQLSHHPGMQVIWPDTP